LFALEVLGSGISFRSASAFGSSRFAGIWLFGKHPGPPVVTLHAAVELGSLMKISRPFASSVCEKSPCRSSAVGIRYSRTCPGRCTCGPSNE
jgi:hypothetical protein